MTQIIPAILTKNADRARSQLTEIAKHGNKVHLDIMDGNFVPNKTFTPATVPKLRTKVQKIIHAMCYHPEWYVKEWRGCKVLFHAEACPNLAETARALRKTGKRPGIVLSPESPVRLIEPALRYVDEVLVMTVHPGFMGQKFLARPLRKVPRIKQLKKSIKVSVDGGVHHDTAHLIAKVGADIVYVGSELWKGAYGVNLENLKKCLK